MTIHTDPHPTTAGPTTLGPIVQTYIGERQRRGELMPDTVRTVRNHLYQFAAFWGRRPLDQLSHKAVDRWIEIMHASRMATSTQATRLSSLRTFARWCVLNRVVDRDWTIGAAKVRRPRVTPRDVTNDHFWRVLAAARTPRERLIVWLMFDVGCRAVEVHRLNVDDVDLAIGEVFLVGKGLHERSTPFTPALRTALDEYLDVAGHGTGALIRTEDDRRARLGKERISGIVGHLFRISGVKRRPYDGRSGHGLRAAGASDLADVVDDIRVVQQFLGHAGLQNLGPYLRRAEQRRVLEAQLARPHARRAA
jgi:integrase/recombinase XerC